MSTTKLSKTDELLLQTFVRNGMIHEGTIDSDNGTSARWRYLHNEGMVSFTYKSGRGMLGHCFAGKLTQRGLEYITNDLLTD